MNDNPLKVLVVEPRKRPYVQEIDGSLASMQKLVGGTIQAVYPFDDAVALICHDEGKLLNLPYNRFLYDKNHQPYDVICGTFLVVGLGEESFASLPPELAQKYEEEFHQPEAFLPLGRRLMVIPVPDESVQSDAEKAVSKPPVEHDR